jgi:hypothetical protein
MNKSDEYYMARMEDELQKIMNLKRPELWEAAELLYDLFEEYPDLSDDQIFTKFRLLLRRGSHKFYDKIKERRGRKSTFERGMVGG